MNTSRNLNLPNCISAARIALVPVLLWMASSGAQQLFTAVLASALAMDILDGFLARRLNQQTRLGAQLDSWGDFLTALVYVPAAVWLRPEALRGIAWYAAIAAIAYLAPIVFGFAKYRRLTSYHTRLMTVTAYCIGISTVSFFAGWSDWPFRVSCVLLVVAQIEEVAISAALPVWQENVRDYRHALAIRSRVCDRAIRSAQVS